MTKQHKNIKTSWIPARPKQLDLYERLTRKHMHSTEHFQSIKITSLGKFYSNASLYTVFFVLPFSAFTNSPVGDPTRDKAT